MDLCNYYTTDILRFYSITRQLNIWSKVKLNLPQQDLKHSYLNFVKKGTCDSLLNCCAIPFLDSCDSLLNYLNSIDPNIKFIIEPSNEQGAIPFLDTFPRPSGHKIITLVYRKHTHMDRYLDFNSNHPKSAKHAVVRALTDRAKNVCSSPELLVEEMDHLGKVLKYNNCPKWMIDQHVRNSS